MALLSFDGDKAYKKYAETSVSKNFKLVPIESIKIEGGEVSEDDIHLLEYLLSSLGSSASFTIDICGDIYSGVKFGIDDGDSVILTIGDVEKYGVCIRLTPNIESGRIIYSCELDPKKYGKDLNASYYLRVYAEVSDLDVTNDYRFLVDRKRAIEFGKDTNLIAAKPYIEETYDANGNLIGAKLYGHTKIRYNAFSNCTNLALTSLPEGLKSIGDSAFKKCTNLALTSLPESLKSIGIETFAGCANLALTSLPEGLTSIGNAAFSGCTNLALTSLPESLTSIGDTAFSDCTSLALTSLPESLTSIGEHTFRGCTSLALTSLPAGVTSIGHLAFFNCANLALTSLPEGLTSIGNAAFSGCTNLALTSLPESLTSIGNNAFQNCTSLTSIIFKRIPTTIESSAFSGCTNLTDIKVPWSEGAVKNAPWGATNATITYNYTGA